MVGGFLVLLLGLALCHGGVGFVTIVELLAGLYRCVLVLRQVLTPISVSPAGRGGEGSRRWLGASWFWCWCCRWSSSPATLLWPAEVARGVEFAGVSAARMVDLVGRRCVDGKKGGAGELGLWPCSFIELRFRCGAADGCCGQLHCVAARPSRRFVVRRRWRWLGILGARWWI